MLNTVRKTAVILLSFATAVLAPAQSRTAGQSDGPEIIVDRANPDIFPESWLTTQVSAKAELASGDEQQRCREIVKAALAKYPVAVLSANLKKVYVLGRLEYRGVPTGGTNSRNAVYVAGKARYSAAQIENIVHAEFSSILLRNFSSYLDKEAWQQINPPDFTYRGSGVQAVKDKLASLRLSDALHEEGFLHEYSKASMEEDFNSYAARLFIGDAELWSAIEKYPKLKAKAELTLAFYGKVNASFTKAFFVSLRQAQ
jgi:hypothetical protein